MKNIKDFITSQLKNIKKPISQAKDTVLIQYEQVSSVLHDFDATKIIHQSSLERLLIIKYVAIRWSSRELNSDSHRWIAQATKTSISTVQRTFNDLRDRNLLSWDAYHMSYNEYNLDVRLKSRSFLEQITRALMVQGIFCLSMIASKPSVVLPDRQLSSKVLDLRNKSVSSYVSNVVLEAPLKTTLISSNERGKKSSAMTDLQARALQKLCERFPLTAHGIVKLSAYSVGAIVYATRQAESALTKADPFEYFAALCWKYDRANRIAPDWSGYQARRQALGIDKEDATWLYFEALEQRPAAIVVEDRPLSTQQRFESAKKFAEPAVKVADGEADKWRAICTKLEEKYRGRQPQLNSADYFLYKMAVTNRKS